MDAAASISNTLAVQQAIETLVTLNFSAYLYSNFAVVSDDETFDFIVVGGGAAGCVVARRLAEDGVTKVLLIEAGGNPPFEANLARYTPFLQQTIFDWNFLSQGDGCLSGCQRFQHCHNPLGKMLGGSSSLGYLIYGVGNRDDYSNWAVAANSSSWNAKHVLPYFIKSQMVRDTSIRNSPDRTLFGYDGPIILTREKHQISKDIINGFQEAGNPAVENFNINQAFGYTTGMLTLGNGVRQNTALKYLSPIKKYKNMKVLRHALVTEIIFDKKKNAVAVRIVVEGKKEMVLNARKEIILCAGAINTPKLLMLSGVGPKKHLESKGVKVISDLPVGQNLKDHSRIALVFNFKNTPPINKAFDPHQYPAALIDGYAALNKSESFPDYKTLQFVNYAQFLMVFCTHICQLSNDICNRFFAPCGKNTDQTKNIMMFTLLNSMHLKCEGEVLLNTTKYSDAPVINFPYCLGQADLKKEVKYIEDYMKVLKTEAFKKLDAVWVDPQLKQCKGHPTGSFEYWICYVRCLKVSMYDFCGTSALGSVVDSRLFVKGVKRLRVADSSVMPTIPSSGILGATIMIGEKAADMIKKAYNLKR